MIGDLLSQFYQALVSFIARLFSFLISLGNLWFWFFTTFWGTVLFVLVYIYDTTQLIIPLLSNLVSGSGVSVPLPIFGALTDAFSLANAILPLTEFFVIVVSLIGQWLICATIRFLKSWIPTVN